MSQRDSQKSIIDGHEYEVFMLAPKTARRILVEMVKVVGPALGQLVDSTPGGISKIMEMDTEGIKWASIIGELSTRLDADMLDAHMSALAEKTHVGGKPLAGVFDLHFMGGIGTMFKWYAFALKVNYGNFTGALESVSAHLPAPKVNA